MRWLLVMAVLPLGCSAMVANSQASPDNLKRRATFDLSCDKDKLELTKLGYRIYGVQGCGHRATYVWTQQDSMGNGNWVMNTVDGQVGQPAGSGSPPAVAAPGDH